jgi:hypothetical protein
VVCDDPLEYALDRNLTAQTTAISVTKTDWVVRYTLPTPTRAPLATASNAPESSRTEAVGSYAALSAPEAELPAILPVATAYLDAITYMAPQRPYREVRPSRTCRNLRSACLVCPAEHRRFSRLRLHTCARYVRLKLFRF